MQAFQLEVLRDLSGEDRLRPFLVGVDQGNSGLPRVTMHTVQSVSRFSERRRIDRLLRDRGLSVRCRIRRHSQKSLSRPRSLEAFLKPFGHANFASDPTGSIGRAKDLVGFSRSVRGELGAKLLGLFWDSQRQLIFVILDHRRFFADKKVKAANLASVEELVRAGLKSSLGGHAGRFVAGLRLGFELPATPLVAIDEVSRVEKRAMLQGLRTRAFVAALGAMIGLGAAAGVATAADVNREAMGDAAVSAPNFDIGILGGVRDDEELIVAEGSATLPLGHAFGVRVDATAGVSNDDFAGGAAGHLFWRDPAFALLGVQGGYFSTKPDNATSSEDFGRIGAMGELYIEDFTLLANAGGQFGDSKIKDGFYGGVGLEWFATENLMLHVNGEYDPERDGLARFGIEFLPGLEALPGLSVYAEGAVGSHSYERVLAGFRIHFGAHGQRSLKDRYRYDTFRNTNTATGAIDVPDAEPQSSYTPIAE